MMARAERGGAANFGAPVPADAPCMNEQPFRQKARLSPQISPPFAILGALSPRCKGPQQPGTGPRRELLLPIKAPALQGICQACRAPLHIVQKSGPIPC